MGKGYISIKPAEPWPALGIRIGIVLEYNVALSTFSVPSMAGVHLSEVVRAILPLEWIIVMKNKFRRHRFNVNIKILIIFRYNFKYSSNDYY